MSKILLALEEYIDEQVDYAWTSHFLRELSRSCWLYILGSGLDPDLALAPCANPAHEGNLHAYLGEAMCMHDDVMR